MTETILLKVARELLALRLGNGYKGAIQEREMRIDVEDLNATVSFHRGCLHRDNL